MSKEYNVPIRSLIDHIKTAVDVDPWAKEMVEELLQKQEPKMVMQGYNGEYCPSCSTPSTRAVGLLKLGKTMSFCPWCGQAVKWEC